jgi:hypothetical protein
VPTTFWSVKGGVGVSAVAALFALSHAGQAEPTLLVDLCGDQPALLGLPEPDGPGILDWAAAPGRPADAINRISVDATPDLRVVPRGGGWPEGDASEMVDALAQQPGHVVVDAGASDAAFARDVVRRSEQRLLVLRCCYLTLRAAQDLDITPTGVVLERGRALGPGDVESVTGVPVVAEIALDIGIARNLDAGLLASRPPRALLRTLANVAVVPA